VADDPRKAFLLLWAVNGGTPNSYALTQSWARVFGFAHPKVRSFVQRLEGADRCERFCAWEGEPPAIVPLVRNPPATQIVCGLGLGCLSLVWHMGPLLYANPSHCPVLPLLAASVSWLRSCQAEFPAVWMCHLRG
jgi:hypothetical protein